jgi:hypothetical protein
MQTTAVVVAAGALCWWAVYTLDGHGQSGTAAAGSTRTAPAATPDAASSHAPAVGSLTSPGASPDAGTSSAPGAGQSSAPPASFPANAAGVSSVHVTLLGGSSSVPQIAVLITVTTDGTGQVTVTGDYYGAAGSDRRTPESQTWALSGHTSYSFSVPIANSPYCGTVFTFTASSGGTSDTQTTAPGC